jgi:hypothetical protein
MALACYPKVKIRNIGRSKRPHASIAYNLSSIQSFGVSSRAFEAAFARYIGVLAASPWFSNTTEAHEGARSFGKGLEFRINRGV